MNAIAEFGLIRSRTLVGIQAIPVLVEAQLLPGLPRFTIVGLPETAVRESRDRIRGAIKAAGIDFPERAIVVNLAPAHLPKQGGRFDLPIALAILQAMGCIDRMRCNHYEFVGELSLAGRLREVQGTLPTALAVGETDRGLVVPDRSAGEATLCEKATIYAAESLPELIAGLAGSRTLSAHRAGSATVQTPELPDMSDVRGQQSARRALEIACAGGHNLMMVGPPGTGKSMLANRACGILPPMSIEEAVETASIESISSKGFHISNWRRRPFRSPHHTVSGVALVGGGSSPRPGEISLAHNGILFLDELAEFPRSVLDVLREPLESGHVSIARASCSADFPASFQLVAATNPCPCGHAGDPDIACRCSEQQINRYLSRLSGPFLDRIDIQVGVPRIDVATLRKSEAGESSVQIRERVSAARELQLQRQGCNNAKLGVATLETVCAIESDANRFLEQAGSQLKLSLRGHHRVLRVARSIADLEATECVQRAHVLEAIAYRQLVHQGTRAMGVQHS